MVITILKSKCGHLKKLEKVNRSLIKQLIESLEDAKHNRIRRVA